MNPEADAKGNGGMLLSGLSIAPLPTSIRKCPTGLPKAPLYGADFSAEAPFFQIAEVAPSVHGRTQGSRQVCKELARNDKQIQKQGRVLYLNAICQNEHQTFIQKRMGKLGDT